MSALITGDLQAEWNTLDTCQMVWDQILSICIERKLKAIVVAGDHKRQYNPIDTRVVLWWQNAIKRAVGEDIDVVSALGNHDRVGQYTDAVNWLPILRRAGAITFSKPGVYNSRKGDYRIFVLPFAGVATTRNYAKELVKQQPDKRKDILIFHQDLKGAKYDSHGRKSSTNLSCDDISSSSYKFVVGGHVHLPQTIGKNGYYVGSPAAEDWGEANQDKRYLIYSDRRLESVKSCVPGWYDPSVPNFRAPASWRGTRIRIQVPISSSARSEFPRVLRKAERDGERRYPGAIITVVGRHEESDDSSGEGQRIRAEDSDRVKLKEYIKHSDYVGETKPLLKYMLEKLSHFEGGLRTGSKIKILRAWGRNFLPFKKVDLDFRNKGITLVQGINEDRAGKSNGAAKTSLTQLLPVALFGQTFKEQSHDHWANRWVPRESAEAGLVLRDERGRKLKVVRGRRPVSLRLFVNGKDQSSGMKSNDRDATQAQIEQVTGFVWKTFANAVYIDRSIANTFLTGTKKQRTEVLSRFQNLERFSKAFELVKKDVRSVNDLIEEYRRKLSFVKGSIIECKEHLVDAKDTAKAEIKGLYNKWQEARKDAKQWARKHRRYIKKLEHKELKFKSKYDKASKEAFKIETALKIAEDDYRKGKNEYDEWIKLKSGHHCPLCLQDVEEGWVEKRARSLKAHVLQLDIKRDYEQARVIEARKKVHMLDAKCTEISVKVGKLTDEAKSKLLAVTTYKNQYRELHSDQHSSETIVGKTKFKLDGYVAKKIKFRRKIRRLRNEQKMYQYACDAFSRDGIPAFLNRQLCPVLNKSAEYYAELFSDNEIEVRFRIVKGEFVPEIINNKGGERIKDQSEGEEALAGLIASFALREAAPKTNVLILDEPGAGLDEQTTKQFARALLKLKERFGSIWVITHNQVLLSELSGERIITVRKKNGISKVIGE